MVDVGTSDSLRIHRSSYLGVTPGVIQLGAHVPVYQEKLKKYRSDKSFLTENQGTDKHPFNYDEKYVIRPRSPRNISLDANEKTFLLSIFNQELQFKIEQPKVVKEILRLQEKPTRG